MPLQEKAGEQYIQTHKIHVDSINRTDKNRSVYDYTVELPYEIKYVTGVELTSYNIPRDTGPSFGSGSNVVDFSLSNATTTTVFSLELPARKLVYSNPQAPHTSYTHILEYLLNDAVKNDPFFGRCSVNQATFTVPPMPMRTTKIAVAGPGVTGFQLLFDSGVNKPNAAWEKMGWSPVPASDSPLALSIESPAAVWLDDNPYVDVNLKQVENFRPIERVFLSDPLGSNVTLNDPNVTRPRLRASQPTRYNRLNVILELPDGSKLPGGPEHNLVFTFYTVESETSVPRWSKQVFSL